MAIKDVDCICSLSFILSPSNFKVIVQPSKSPHYTSSMHAELSTNTCLLYTSSPARNAVSAFRGFNISPAEVDSQYLVYLALLVRLNLSARRADGAYPARTCSIRTTLLRDRPPVPALNPIYVGRFVLSYLKMMTAMLTSL